MAFIMNRFMLRNFAISHLRLIILLVLGLCIGGCAALKEKPAAPPKRLPPPERLVLSAVEPPVLAAPSGNGFLDDLDQISLEAAISRSLQYYDSLPASRSFRIGREQYSVQDMKETLLAFLDIIRGPEPAEVKIGKIRESFLFYKSAGHGGRDSALYTGYFEPVLEGSLKPDENYRYPVYGIPDDLVVINLGRFRNKFRGERIVGRLEGREMIPYHDRRTIDELGSLRDRDLEIVWLSDPIGLFFLHIQGSGTIVLPDGSSFQVSYADCNGRPYRSIGKYLLERGRLTEQEMSHRSIVRFLREHPEEMASVLNHNESYVFFRKVTPGPIGSLGVPVTGGRSIATDLDLYPRGGLALISLRKPVFDAGGEIVSWAPVLRFVLNQDTGGVIKGAGRVDLFCGKGDEGERIAGSLKERGELYFLVRKKAEPGDQRAGAAAGR